MCIDQNVGRRNSRVLSARYIASFVPTIDDVTKVLTNRVESYQPDGFVAVDISLNQLSVPSLCMEYYAILMTLYFHIPISD